MTIEQQEDRAELIQSRKVSFGDLIVPPLIENVVLEPHHPEASPRRQEHRRPQPGSHERHKPIDDPQRRARTRRDTVGDAEGALRYAGQPMKPLNDIQKRTLACIADAKAGEISGLSVAAWVLARRWNLQGLVETLKCLERRGLIVMRPMDDPNDAHRQRFPNRMKAMYSIAHKESL